MSYVIAHPKGAKKPILYRVVKQSGSALRCQATDATRFDKTTSLVDVRQGDVVVALGDKPMYGTVYGVPVEPALRRDAVHGWGFLTYFVDMDDAAKDRLGKALSASMAVLKRWGLAREWFPLDTEVRNPKGRILGTYAYRPKGTDRIVLRPLQGISTRELVKVIVHECGHGVWHRILTSQDRARWISMYNRCRSVRTVEVGKIKQFVRGMREMGSLRDFNRECDDTDQVALGRYLEWLKKVHGLSTFEVQDLLAAGENPPIPDTHLHVGTLKSPITLYSKESASEMFCEALSSMAVKDLSNPQVKALLGKTIKGA